MKNKTEDMTNQQFERYLKRNKISGLGAVSAWRSRRARIEMKGDKSNDQKRTN